MFDSGSNRPGYGGQQIPPPDHIKEIPAFTLLAWAAIIVVSTLLFIQKQHASAPRAPISQAEFLDRFASNQIVQATIAINQQSLPLVEVTGTYRKTDAHGNVTQEEVPFVVHNFLLAGETQETLAHSPKITFSSQNTVLLNLVWGIAPFLVLGALFWFFLLRRRKTP